ncbi:MAG: HNH endonuclease [Gemmatimonadetes bacterium]|nr:HNH endonuclease [Gemmatimonadota bacterium]
MEADPSHRDLPMAHSALDSLGRAGWTRAHSRERYPVMLHVDERTLSDDGGIGSSDFEGGTRASREASHHVRHWADGGETSLGNCLLLCRYRHRLVHEGGAQRCEP